MAKADPTKVGVAVLDANDIPRALRVIHQRLWLAGLGWVSVTNSGRIVEHALVKPVPADPGWIVLEVDREEMPAWVAARLAKYGLVKLLTEALPDIHPEAWQTL